MLHKRPWIVGLAALIVLVIAGTATSIPPSSPAAAQGDDDFPYYTSLDCTFEVIYPLINLRKGPGLDYARAGFLRNNDEIAVTGQAPGTDGYVWWQLENDFWVRSTLGTSDCDSTCGNTVCEYGEDIDSCAEDCTANRSIGGISSQSSSCVAGDCQECYESIWCYPDCNDCDCWQNENGCATCYCRYPGSSSTSDSDDSDDPTATGSQCDYESCQACYDAYPCWPNECSVQECSLNEYGCPVCETAP